MCHILIISTRCVHDTGASNSIKCVSLVLLSCEIADGILPKYFVDLWAYVWIPTSYLGCQAAYNIVEQVGHAVMDTGTGDVREHKNTST